MGLRFDESRFLAAYAARFGVPTSSARAGLAELLAAIAADPWMTDVRWISYALATEYHEGMHGFQPIDEIGKGRGRRYGRARRVKARDGSVRTVVYYGRGRVQLTWLENYVKADRELRLQYPDAVARFERRTGTRLDLVGYPEQALDPELSYLIMSAGMRQGWFARGQTLARWLSPTSTDYLGARRVINGTDRAAAIAGHARKFEACLRAASLEALPASPPEPSPARFLAAEGARPAGASVAGLLTGAVAALQAGLPYIALGVLALGAVAGTIFAVWAVRGYLALRREQGRS